MWVKYAAMFAMLLMCGCGTQHRVGGNYYATLDDAKAPLAVMPTSDENGEFSRLLKMSLKEKFHYFLERQDVKEQLYRGAMRAVVIPLQSPMERKEQENLLLIRTKGDFKSVRTRARLTTCDLLTRQRATTRRRSVRLFVILDVRNHGFYRSSASLTSRRIRVY